MKMFKLQNTKLIRLILSGLFVVCSVFLYNVVLGATVSAAETNCTTSNLTGKAYRDACGCQSKTGINAENCSVVAYLQLFIRFLSAAVGVVIVIMIAVRGIQYTAARENPQIVHNARIGILNAIMALILYLFTFAFLQWIVPGGVV